MKKILCFILAAVFCLSLASCKFSDPVDRSTTSVDEDTTDPADTTAVSSSKDYDDSGKFILESTDNRVVYKLDGGYIIFKFSGSSPYKIYNVIELEDAAAVSAYLEENVVNLMSSGVYDNVTSSDNLIILSYNVSESGIGRYYTYNKEAILKEFESTEAN